MRKTVLYAVRPLLWTVGLVLASQATLAPAMASHVYFDDFLGDPSNGRFVMEAEHYAARAADQGGGWWEVAGDDHRFLEGPRAGELAPNVVPNSRGSYMEVLSPGPGGTNPPIGSAYDGSVMEYRFAVETTGSYRLYARWRGDGPFTDSIYASIWKPDGTLLTGAGPMWFTFHQWRSGWIWDNRGIKDSTVVSGVGFPHAAIWTMAEPGIYTLRISQREKESALDAMVFQTDGLAAPTGLGPPESSSTLNVVMSRFDIGGATVTYHKPGFDEFTFDALFELGAESDGVFPWQEGLTIQMGGYTESLPAGSLNCGGRWCTYSQSGPGIFKIALSADFIRVWAHRVDLSGVGNPPTFSLRIGDDVGETRARLSGSLTRAPQIGEAPGTRR